MSGQKKQRKTYTRIDAQKLREIESLAQIGSTVTDIARIVHIERSKIYRNKKALEALERGRSQFKARIEQQVRQMALREKKPSEAMLKLLVDRLGCFTTEEEIPKPTNAKEAVEAMGELTRLIASGRINGRKANLLMRSLDMWTKLYNVAELEERLQRLEEKFDAEEN